MIPMAYHFALHPWDIDRLTVADFEIYAMGIESMEKEAERARKEAGSPVRKR